MKPTTHFGYPIYQWIGLRDNLQETSIFNGKNHGFLQIFPQSNDWNLWKSPWMKLLNSPNPTAGCPKAKIFRLRLGEAWPSAKATPGMVEKLSTFPTIVWNIPTIDMISYDYTCIFITCIFIIIIIIIINKLYIYIYILLLCVCKLYEELLEHLP